MAEEEKGAKWWFRYVIVPIIGGGGAIAVITAYIAKPSESTPATSTVAAPQESHPEQPGTQPAKPSFTFNVDYDHRIIRGITTTNGWVHFVIKVYIDDRLIGTIDGDGSGDIQKQDVTVSTLGKHRYNLLGTVENTLTPSGGVETIKVGGEGTISIQDGSEFFVVPDHSITNRPHVLSLKLERTY